MNEPGMLLNDSVSGSQAHACAFAALFGGKKRLEDALAGGRVHAEVSGSQAHACAFAALFGGKKRLEDALAGGRVHADAGIGNRDNRVASGGHVWIKAAVGLIE